MRKTYKFRLEPTAQQEQVLDRWLYLCRHLYNAMLEQRIFAWRQRRKSISKYDQMRELPNLKAEMPQYAEIGSQVLQDVAKRLDQSFQRFFKQGLRHLRCIQRHLARQGGQRCGLESIQDLLAEQGRGSGQEVVEKNPRNTSQECSGCGRLVPKELHVRWHQCVCGTSLHRDHNAAIVILKRPA